MCLFTLYNVSSKPPGYLEEGNISRDEYLQNPGTEIINNTEIELKYCDTCKIRRELRSFHCNICGKCIRKHGNKFNN